MHHASVHPSFGSDTKDDLGRDVRLTDINRSFSPTCSRSMTILSIVKSSKVGYQADNLAASICDFERCGKISGSGPEGMGMGMAVLFEQEGMRLE